MPLLPLPDGASAEAKAFLASSADATWTMADLSDAATVTISPLGIIFDFCLYKTQEDIKHVMFHKVLGGVQVRGLRDDNAMIGREHWKIVQEQIGHDAVRLSESAVGGIDCQWVHNCKGEGEQGKQDTGDQAPVILYFFGGAFVVGSPEDDLAITAKLAHFTRLSVCVPRYRRAPENPYPRAIEDAAAVYRELVGVQRRRVLLVGESAGGHLALRLLLDVLGDRELAAPEAVALLSPWADLSHSGDSHVVCQNLDPTLSVEHFLHPATCAYMGVPADASGTEKAKSPDVSPLFADMPARFPPVIITTGTRDLLMSDSIRLVAW